MASIFSRPQCVKPFVVVGIHVHDRSFIIQASYYNANGIPMLTFKVTTWLNGISTLWLTFFCCKLLNQTNTNIACN